MNIKHCLFTLGNILSFTLVSYNCHLGYTIGVLAALLGMYIFKKDIWLTLTQVFYLIINSINFILFL